MKIRVKEGMGCVVATHVGKGDERRMLFIAPWGCSLSTPKPAPEKADLSNRAYMVEVTGEVERLLRAAISEGHKGLVDRIEIVDAQVGAPTGAISGTKSDAKSELKK